MLLAVALAYAAEDSTTTITSTIRPYTWTPRAADPNNWNRWNYNDWNRNHDWNRNNNNDWTRKRWDWNRWNNTGYNHNDWNRNRWDSRYDGYPRDWRTLRLEEKADARGYTYVYETVGGIIAEETGVFESVGLRHEGQRIHGQVTITDPRDGVIYKINYQTESKEAYVHRGNRDAERVPPTIARLLALLESHK